jgi:hypothetical protein
VPHLLTSILRLNKPSRRCVQHLHRNNVIAVTRFSGSAPGVRLQNLCSTEVRGQVFAFLVIAIFLGFSHFELGRMYF